MDFTCMPVQTANKVLGNMPNVPAIKNFWALTPKNAMMAFVMAKGKTGDSRAKNTQENEFDCTWSRNEAVLNFDLMNDKMASPFNNLATKNPSNEAIEYAIIRGMMPCKPQIYPVNKAKKVVGLNARPIIKMATHQKTSRSMPCKD